MVRPPSQQQGHDASERLLTDTELELMQVVWELGEGTVNAVLDQLASDRQLAYTSVSTILRILEKKGFLASRKAGRAHIYSPLLTKGEYEQRSISHLVDNLFQGQAFQLASRFIDSTKLSAAELERLRKLLEEKKNEC